MEKRKTRAPDAETQGSTRQRISPIATPLGTEIKRRGPKRPTDVSRQVILEAATTLLIGEPTGLPGLEQVAAYADVHKMTIYRAFGSREQLENACIEWLCDRELALWRKELDRCRGAPGCQVRALFHTLAESLRQGAHTGLRTLALHSRDSSDAVRVALDTCRHDLREFLLETAEQFTIDEPAVLADVLCLVWEAAVIPERTPDERRQVANALPAVIDRLVGTRPG